MNQEKYIHLIYLQLQGALSDSEAQELNAWLDTSSENKKIQEEIVQSVDLMEDFKPSFQIDMDGDYAKISDNLGLGQKKSKLVSMTSRNRWIGIAAAVALLLVATFVFKNGPEPELEWQVLQSTVEKKRQVTLAEGSIVLINKNSRLDYPKSFPGKTRPVKLEGEGFFTIKRNTGQPFQVLIDGAVVEVLGTEFGVRAHPDEDKTIVTVASGKVAFKGTEPGQSVILTAGEEAVLDKKTKAIKKLAESNPNAFSYMSGELVFKNTYLSTVFRDLERHFGVVIECQNPALEKCSFSLTPQRVELKEVLDALILSSGLEVVEVDGKYLVSGSGC